MGHLPPCLAVLMSTEGLLAGRLLSVLLQVEYNVNNMQHAWEHPNPRSLERLLRRLLGLPSRPLVVGVMLQSFNEFHVRCRRCAAAQAPSVEPLASSSLPLCSSMQRSALCRLGSSAALRRTHPPAHPPPNPCCRATARFT